MEMMQNFDHIKNLVFDLGGVILDIDLPAAVEAMSELGVIGFESNTSHFKQTETLNHFEKGLISEKEFIERVKKESPLHVREEDVITAWNVIVRGFPKERLELLDRLKRSSRFRLFLLSNTNSLHQTLYTDLLRMEHSLKNGLDDLFDKVYLSHEIHMRKPDAEIYQFVLEDGKMVPGETFFIDDSLENIEAAGKLGINTYHLSDGVTINDLFPEQLIAKWI